MASVPVPYPPIGKPDIGSVSHNGVDFVTNTWNVPEDKDYKGTIVYVHGFSEVSELYTNFFDTLSQLGYKVFFFSQRGAPETSPGLQRGKTNEFHTFDDLDHMIELQLAARKNPQEKLILAGHSMGGGIVLNYVIHGKHRKEFKGAFVLGPLVDLHPKTQPNIVLRSLAPVIARVLPGLQIDGAINLEYITSDKKWLEYMRKRHDKHIGTTRQYHDMFLRGKKLLEREHVAKSEPTIALLVLHGTTDFINHFDATKEYTKLWPLALNAKFVPVENGRHSLFQETEEVYKPVVEEVLTFLNGL